LKNRLPRLLLIAGMTVLVDLAAKQIVLRTIPLHENLEVIPGFFSLTHVRNTGAAFGLFAGQATAVRTLLFLAMSIAALGVVLFMYARIADGMRWASTALCLIFGGAVGNLVDRLRFGEVVDFFDVYIGSAHWPAFNVADSAISVGVGILFFHVLTKKI
jgi:signal peptidase II